MASSWARATGKGLLWSGAALVGSRVLTFLSILVLARLLAPSEFGVVAAITTFLALIELISDLGMKAVVVYEQEAGVTDRVRTAFTVNLGFAVALTAVGLLVSPLVASFFRIEEHADLFRLASLNLLLAAGANIHDSMLLRELDFRRRTLPELIRGAVRGGVGVLLAVLGFGAEALVWGMLAGTLAWVVVLWAMIPLRPGLHFDARIARSMFSYGGAAAAHTLLSEVGRFTDTIVIGRVLGERALGLYTVGMRVPELLIRSVGWQVSQVLFPALSKRRVADDTSVGWTTLELVRLQGLYVLPVTAGLATLGTALVVVLFSSTWTDAGPVVAPLAIMAALDVTLSPMGDGMKAIGRQKVLLFMNLVQIPALIVAIVVAGPHGITTVAWTLAVCQLGFAIPLGVAATIVLDLDLPGLWRALRPGLAAAAGTAAGVLAVRLVWDEAELLPVVLASIAGAFGAVAGLRLLASDTFSELLGVARGAVPARGGATS